MNKTVFFLTIMLNALFVSGQTRENNNIVAEKFAEKVVADALKDKSLHNVIDHKTIIIKDSLTAANYAETVLFSIYDKENIIRQKPYEIHLIDSYWVIAGTLPKSMKGSTFLMIFDARNGEILRITHGK